MSQPPRARPSSHSYARGRYEVVRLLGEGGMKRVFLARDTQLGRDVALSAFKSDSLGDPALVRARREAEDMARLGDHPNVVTIYDIGAEDGELFFVSQYMAAGDLSTLLAQSPESRLPIDEAVRIAADVAAGLEHAHAHGVVHRDLKPQNVWLAPDGTAKLGDFGLAVAADRSRITVEGAMVGTVAYMAPEQGLGRSTDTRSDLYALGAVVYELLCGRPPFVGEGAAAVISQHVGTVPVAPRWHRAEIPAPLEQLVLKLLAKSPEERPRDAAEVRAALAAIQAAGRAPAATQDPATAQALDDLRGRARFVGREGELRDLRAAVDEAVAGRPGLVMLSGEAGIGKSRLAAEAESYAQLRGAQVLWGRCYAGEGAPAFWPWVQAIRSYVHTRDPDKLRSELGSGASDIAQVVSEVRERVPGLPEPEPLDPAHARFQLFDSISTFLVNASVERPLVVVLEDLHLADQPSLRLLQFLAGAPTRGRVLVIGTFRDAELAKDHPLREALLALGRERGFAQLSLRGLAKHEVKAVMEAGSGQSLSDPGQQALVDAVAEESGGNPYFIEEILRHLVESGAVYRREGRWVSDARDISELGIPRGVRDAIEQRLARLPEGLGEVLTSAAAIGQEFPLEALERLSRLGTDEVVARLGAAVDAGLLATVHEEGNRYRFRHAATREALYERIPPSERPQTQRAIGEALEELYGDRVESHLGELAYHFAQAAAAGCAQKAVEYAWWAGERAAAIAAFEEAANYYTRALALFDQGPGEPVRRCELLLALGDARFRAGDLAMARTTFLEAAAGAEHLSRADQYARAALGYAGGAGGFSVSHAADQQLLILLRSALERLPERDGLLRARVMARLAVELSYTEEHEATDRLSAEAVEMAQRIGDPQLVLLAVYSRQWSVMGPDSDEQELAAGTDIVRLARASRDTEMEFHGHHLRLDALLTRGDLEGVAKEIRSCEKLARELRQPAYEWQAGAFRVMRALLQGRFSEAERLAKATLALGQRGDPEIATVVFGAHMFFTKWADGSIGELVEGGEAFAARYPRSAWPAAFTMVLSELGEQARARQRLAALGADGFAGVRRDANWLTAMTCLAITASNVGDRAAAEVLYERLLPYADRFTSVITGAACFGSVQLYLGMLAETTGRLDDAIDHFERAKAANAAAGAVFALPRLLFHEARSRARRDAPGDADRAAALVEEGVDAARRMGLTGEVERLLALKLERQGLTSIGVQTSIDAVAVSVHRDRPDLGRAAAPDGTVTIMFSDIEDSTVLTERLGDRRWLELLGEHNRIFREALARHDGYEVKSQGDGFMLAFASARRAIECAIEVQRALARHRAEHPEDPLNVRMGLHTGEALRIAEDFFGKSVILAARIAGKARGGQILVSSLLRELVGSSAEFEFGSEQEFELKGLRGRYRACEVSWEGHADASEETPVRHPLTPQLAAAASRVVGRERELQCVAALRAAAFSGGARLALLTGEPGIGKSSLAARAAAQAHAESAIVVYGWAEEKGGAAYLPWVRALGDLVANVPDDVLAGHVARRGAELGRMVPELSRRLASLEPMVPGADPESERALAFGAASDLLGAASAVAPVVVVLDDLQWADRSTLALLAHLLDAGERARVLVIASHRPVDEQHPMSGALAELAQREHAELIELGGLAEAEVAALIAGDAAAEVPAEVRELAREIHRETNGNPFFATELLRHLADTGGLVRDAHGRLTTGEAATLELPPSVRELVRRRVAQLGEEAARTLAAAAVLGREFEVVHLARMLEGDEASVRTSLQSAARASLLEPVADRPGRYAFAHALVSHTLYQGLGAERRERLHEQAGAALEELCAGDTTGRVAELAYHWVAAAGRDPGRAARFALAAGQSALNELAPDEALRWLERAHAVIERLSDPDAALRCDMLIATGNAQRQTGDRRYRRTLLEASAIAQDLADGPRAARAALANTRGWTAIAGRVDEARVAALERALSLLARRDRTRARLLAQLALERVYEGDLDRRLTLSDEALALARRDGEDRTLAYVLGRRYLTIWAPETLDERLETVAEFETVADRLGDPIAAIGAASWRLLCAWEAGDLPAADEALERKAALAERIGRPVMRWEVRFQRSARAYLAGRLDEAEALAGEAAAIGRDQPDAGAIYAAQIVAVRYDQGRLDEFAELFAQAAEANAGLSTMQAALAQMYCELDRPEDARRIIAREARQGFTGVPRDNLWLTTMAAYGDAIAQLADAEPAAAMLPLIEPYADRLATNGVNLNGSMRRILGLLTATVGRRQDAERHFAAACAVHERIEAPVFLARTRWEWARMLLRAPADGNAARARELLGHAAETAAAHKCTVLERRIAETMRALDLAPA